ncbi:hypothetical protein QE152_g34250 [Popillia japonica]|uniref:Fibronectin type-III domain-containing protein n=1 Tax=Popillia japonica TaxID=7064 RepID=A0AAW1ITM5_POPJA
MTGIDSAYTTPIYFSVFIFISDILDYSIIIFPTDSSGDPYLPPVFKPKGPKPGPPRNLTVTEHYTIKYRTDGPWKTLNKGQIRPEDTQYLVKNLVGGRTYYFRVLASSLKSYESSDEVKFPVPARVKHKAITAGVVGGILFFIVAIILSVCAVKICNKRKRRKQQKGMCEQLTHLFIASKKVDKRKRRKQQKGMCEQLTHLFIASKKVVSPP